VIPLPGISTPEQERERKAAYQLKYYLANREKIREQHRLYYQRLKAGGIPVRQLTMRERVLGDG